MLNKWKRKCSSAKDSVKLFHAQDYNSIKDSECHENYV